MKGKEINNWKHSHISRQISNAIYVEEQRTRNMGHLSISQTSAGRDRHKKGGNKHITTDRETWYSCHGSLLSCGMYHEASNT